MEDDRRRRGRDSLVNLVYKHNVTVDFDGTAVQEINERRLVFRIGQSLTRDFVYLFVTKQDNLRHMNYADNP